MGKTTELWEGRGLGEAQKDHINVYTANVEPYLSETTLEEKSETDHLESEEK